MIFCKWCLLFLINSVNISRRVKSLFLSWLAFIACCRLVNWKGLGFTIIRIMLNISWKYYQCHYLLPAQISWPMVYDSKDTFKNVLYLVYQYSSWHNILWSKRNGLKYCKLSMSQMNVTFPWSKKILHFWVKKTTF